MIKFFKHIRKSLLMENKTSRYFKYAIGEIILVVIGILIALQVSNWNTQREFDQRLNSYYSKINEELKTVLDKTKEQIKVQESLALQLNIILNILKDKDRSRIPELKKNLGAVATVWTVNFSPDVFDEFVSQEFLSKVKDKELKLLFTDLKHNYKRMNLMDDYNQNQYNTILEPFIANTINYSSIALPKYREGLKQGGPKTDFVKLFESVKLWNRVTFKLETTNLMIRNLNWVQDVIEKLQIKLDSLNLERND